MGVIAAKQTALDPNVREGVGDYPIDDSASAFTPVNFNGVGGSTVLYNAIFPRLLPSDFRVRTLDGVAEDWPLTYEDLLPYYQEIERQFGVSGLAGDPAYPPEDGEFPLPPLPLGRHGRRVAEAHNALGWHWWPQPNAIPSRAWRGQRACAQFGACHTGCPEGAKGSTDVTHWPEAIRLGAQLITRARVSRIVTDAKDRVTGVEYIDADAKTHFQEADVCILAANGVGTPRLLLMSTDSRHPDGLANSSGLVGRRLMMHPFSHVAGFWEDDLETWRAHFGGQLISLQFYETDPSRDFVRGTKWTLVPGGGPLANALTLPSDGERDAWGADHHRLFRERFGHGAAWAVFGEDLPEECNRVTLDPALADSDGLPAPKVEYRISENSERLMDFNIERAVESLEAANAKIIDIDRFPRVSGWHMMGTTVMGDDPATSVVDSNGRCHDIPNLYVADSSVFVTGGAVNPAITLASLSLRLAERLVKDRSRQVVPA